eukprot:6789255-Prorocentrum_lima.AAC.1
MTSSLVGSEMCIRDRLRCPGIIHSSFTSRFTFRACGLCFLLESPLFEAVSYTHLTLPTICSV